MNRSSTRLAYRSALRLGLLGAMAVSFACLWSVSRLGAGRDESLRTLGLSLIANDDIARMQKDAPSDDLKRLLAEREANANAVNELSLLLSQAQFQNFAFLVCAAFMIFLSWVLLDPRVKEGIQAEKVAAAEKIGADYVMKLRGLSAEVERRVGERSAVLEREYASRIANLETRESAAKTGAEEVRNGRQTLEQARMTFDRQKSRANADIERRTSLIDTREKAVDLKHQDAEAKLAETTKLSLALRELVNRLDAHVSCGGSDGEAARALAANPVLAASIANLRT